MAACGVGEALRAEPTSETVQKIVLQRLCVALHTITKSVTKLSGLDVDNFDMQLTPSPDVMFNYAFSKHLSTEIVMRRIVGLLHELRQFPDCTHDLLVVLVVVDEAQELDEIVTPSADAGGARFALRALRELQTIVGCKSILLLPIATGIKPETSLVTQTRGRNVVMGLQPQNRDAVHMTYVDFRKLVERVPGSWNIQSSEQRVLSVVTACNYPCVRPLLRVLPGRDKLGVSSGEYFFMMSPDLAKSVLRAGFDHAESVASHDIPGCIPVEPQPNVLLCRPILHFGVWSGLIQSLNLGRTADAQLRLPLTHIERAVFEERNCAAFEAMTFAAIE